MIFHDVNDREFLACYASENDQWRICVTPSVMGENLVQVWCRRDNRGGFCRYYFCGPGPGFALDVVYALKQILGAQPESLTEAQAVELLPEHTREDGRELRPMFRDRWLFERLMGRAGCTPIHIATLWTLALMLGNPVVNGMVAKPDLPAADGSAACQIVPRRSI